MSEYGEFQALEERWQPWMDELYGRLGFTVVSRQGNRRRDLVLSFNGTQYRVEEKYRDGIYDDLLIEFVQDMASQNWGWYYAEQMDRLVVPMHPDKQTEPKVVYSANWPELKRWLQKDYLPHTTWPKAMISPRGYGITLNILVPLRKIPDGLVKCIYPIEVL